MNHNSNWKKLLGFRKHAEKVRKNNYFYRKCQTIYLPEKRQKFGKKASVHIPAHLVQNEPISIRAFVDVMFHMPHMTMGMEITVNMHPYNKIPKPWTSLYLDKLIINNWYIFQNVPVHFVQMTTSKIEIIVIFVSFLIFVTRP